MFKQRTINKAVELSGIGLHSGDESRMVLCPAPPDTGVVFMVDGYRVEAAPQNVSDTNYATSLECGGKKIRTVEHLLAALAGLMVDNVVIELDGPEVPVMDGSALAFVRAVKSAGIVVQDAPRRCIKILRPIKVTEGDKSVSLLPSTSPVITCRIDFDHPLLHDQRFSVELKPETFEAELCRARTFGFLREVETLRKAGLARGGSLENAVVIDDGRVMNDGGLRYADEFVRHKMLDAVGDLSLVGMPIIGHLVADKPGHKLNCRLVRTVLADKDSWMVLDGVTARDASAMEEVAAMSLSEAVS